MSTIPAKEFVSSNMSFGKAISGGNAGTFRIPISYKNNGKTGSCILESPSLFSFGVSPQANMNETLQPDLSNVQNFTLPLCLHGKDGATEEEQDFINSIDKIVEEVKNYCTTDTFNQQVQKYGDDKITSNDLKKLNPIYRKKDKGVVVNGSNPILYARLVYNKKTNSFITEFYDTSNDTKTNPLDMIETRMKARCAIKIESIFVGSRVSLQVKVWEVNFENLSTHKTRLLTPQLTN